MVLAEKTNDLFLYFFPGCPYCDLVTDTIDRLGLEIPLINIKQDKQAEKKLILETGRKTVPCLYINGRPMHESRDIVAWLEKNQSTISKIN